jgi:hypothetical protein
MSFTHLFGATPAVRSCKRPTASTSGVGHPRHMHRIDIANAQACVTVAPIPGL